MMSNKKSLIAMCLAACSSDLDSAKSKLKIPKYPKWNEMRTANSYGEFNWQFVRRKGKRIAVIQRKGKLYVKLQLESWEDNDTIVELLNEQLAVEAGRKLRK